MTTVNFKPLAQHLTGRIQYIFARSRLIQRNAEGTIYSPSLEQETQEATVDAEVAFLTSVAHLPETERNEHIQRRQWYAALAARQGIAEVEWRQQQHPQTGNPHYRP
jgi:hypothetical protein